MFKPKTRRGRPKGTGIDDSDRISRLVEFLRAHPDLKPTTAIRVMGISDPSAIRRIRDKYKHFLDIARIEATPLATAQIRPATLQAPDPAAVPLQQHG